MVGVRLRLARVEWDSTVGGDWAGLGWVGSGFDEAMLLEIRKNVLDPIVTSSKQVEIQMEEEKNTVWLKPERHCEIQYASITPNETHCLSS